ncbi:lysophospholipid acyltransferase family protein [Chloroflexota bacterium]
MSKITEKPISEVYRPELTRLPPLSRKRKVFRWIVKGVIWVIIRLLIKTTLNGREHLPQHGPALIVSNHLGDADAMVGLALAKVPFDVMGKTELYDIPFFGKLLDWYGTIWVHRGRPDRRALRAALNGLAEGRLVGIAPEARESVSGALEQGTNGAAYIALKAGVPVLPVVLTGTENWRVYGNLKKFRRTQVTATAGPQFRLENTGERHADIEKGTQTIMKTLAQMLPPDYQGVYRDAIEDNHGSK